MSRIIAIFGITMSVLLVATPAKALEDVINNAAEACEQELTTYCKDVTPGGGRILACMFAHEDKLSGRCEYALYDAAAQLERAIAALTYVANECNDDIDAQCAAVEAGEGRILTCLKQNEDKVSKRCQQAMKDIDLQITE
jgi:hypothetical protein